MLDDDLMRLRQRPQQAAVRLPSPCGPGPLATPTSGCGSMTDRPKDRDLARSWGSHQIWLLADP
jgi:hypothetical protein